MSPHAQTGDFKFKLSRHWNCPSIDFWLKLKGHGVPSAEKVFIIPLLHFDSSSKSLSFRAVSKRNIKLGKTIFFVFVWTCNLGHGTIFGSARSRKRECIWRLDAANGIMRRVETETRRPTAPSSCPSSAEAAYSHVECIYREEMRTLPLDTDLMLRLSSNPDSEFSSTNQC